MSWAARLGTCDTVTYNPKNYTWQTTMSAFPAHSTLNISFSEQVTGENHVQELTQFETFQ